MKLYKNAKGDDLCVSEDFVKDFETRTNVKFEQVTGMLHGTNISWKRIITEDRVHCWELSSDCHLDSLIYPENEPRNPNGQPLHMKHKFDNVQKEEVKIQQAFKLENDGSLLNVDSPYAKWAESLSSYDSDVKKTYVYSEGKFLDELRAHIDKTNQTHYAGPVQPTEFIMSHASSLDFLVGNVIKYTFRFGKKNGYNKEDLFKAAHYLSMMAHFADEKFEKKE